MKDWKKEEVSADAQAFESTLRQVVFGGVFLLGGVLTVFTLLITNANLGSPKAMDILSFGCTAGMILLVAGAFGMGVFKKDPRRSNG